MACSVGPLGMVVACLMAAGTVGGAAIPPEVASHLVPAPDTTVWVRLARDIHAETNALRRDPAAYARHLERMLPGFDGTLLERRGRPSLRTDEGATAVAEAIAELQARRPVGPLRWSKGLTAAAGDHVRDQGPVGGLEHTGTDRSDPARRASRYGRWVQGIAENIAYGENSAREVVIQLLVDDGVPGRGHRDNMLSPNWGAGGVACGPHLRYRQMCVMDYAVRYVER
ncbi:MAG: CAP domain-containing protein [Gemmatimonadales bacterium]|nr:CAP domain-containing protein [Gemmatimonadales bacterium]